MGLDIREWGIIGFLLIIFALILGPLVTIMHYMSHLEKDRIDLYHIYIEVPVVIIGCTIIGFFWFLNRRLKEEE
jgi:uncharacterized BrkB/YihY/UPF0761 family membrane protein